MKTSPGAIAVDLDNTIICYDVAFQRAALERGWIEADTPTTKTAVKKAILESAGNKRWTELQGFVYGPGLEAATPYPGALEFFRTCLARNVEARIISHKTQFAKAGPGYDLRLAAFQWLQAHGFLETGPPPIFTDTRTAKLTAVRTLGCKVLIDDLPEVYCEPDYPQDARFLLFDPDGEYPHWKATLRATSWAAVPPLLWS